MFARLVAAALASALLAVPALAQTTGTLKKIAESKTIALGFLPESVPFSFADSNGQPSGYSVDLCKRCAAGLHSCPPSHPRRRASGPRPIAAPPS